MRGPSRSPRQRLNRAGRARATVFTFTAAVACLVAFQHFRAQPGSPFRKSGSADGIFGSRQGLDVDEDHWPEWDRPECQANPARPECSPQDFTVLADGDLESRINAVCAAHAIRRGTQSTARAVWVANNMVMPHTKFTDLFQAIEYVKNSEETGRKWKARLDPFYRDLTVSACEKGVKWGLPPGISFGAFLSPRNINHMAFEDPCSVLRHYKSCFALLQPSHGVESLIMNEPHLDRLGKSVAVFVDQVSPGGACGGCAGNDSAPDLCMMRRLTRQYLRDPSRDFTVGALAAADAPSVASFFEPSRAPLVLQVTQRRAAMCPFSPPLGVSEVLARQGDQDGSPSLTWRRRRLLEEDEGARLAEQLSALAQPTQDEGAKLAASGEQTQARPARRNPRPKGFFEIDEEKKAQMAAQATDADKGLSAGAENATVVPIHRVTQQDLAECVRLQAAELFALTQAEGFIPTNDSTMSSLFIASKGAMRSELFRSQAAVCKQQPIRPITKQRFAMFVIIEEKLKLMYCAIPKVACTSWLMWLRAQLGYKDPKNPWLALHEYDSGLKNLAIHFSERQATRLITHPGFFKFTFVRNPFSRAASAYSNKIVKSDTPGKKTGPGSRSYWNWAFFRWVQPLFDAVKDEDDLVSFQDFTKLVEAVTEKHRWHMDRHIAPQVDICQLNSIKYDFVGKFENLQDDVRTIVNRYGGQFMEVFNFGRNAHYTNATAKLAKIFDQESYNAVKRIYAQDFFVALNNITQETPQDLQRLFE